MGSASASRNCAPLRHAFRKESPYPSPDLNRACSGNLGDDLVCPSSFQEKRVEALLSTDLSLTAQEIIQVYRMRWDIEVFLFRCVKSLLLLQKEFQAARMTCTSATPSLYFRGISCSLGSIGRAPILARLWFVLFAV